MKYAENSKKTWSITEVEYLKSRWGETNIKTIARKLGRTLHSVKNKAFRIGLGDWRFYHEYISLNQLHELIFHAPIDTYTMGIWERAGMPYKNIKPINKSLKMISLDSFIRWYKNHKRIIDISLTQDGDFGDEPDWLKEKRKADKMALCYKARFWTQSDDQMLKSLLKTYRYGYRDLSVRLKRTEGAIKRRILDLGLKERPLRQDPHSLWKQEDILKVKDLYLKGYKSCVIAEYVPKSALAINGLIERYDYFGDTPKKERGKI